MVDTNTPILQRIKSTIWATDPDATLILFGSYARGDNRPDSDIDILVLLDKDRITLDDRKRIGYPLYDIQLETDTLISPRLVSKNQWEKKHSITPFYKNVLKIKK